MKENREKYRNEALLAITIASITITGEFHVDSAGGSEGDEAEAVGYELIVEDRGVHLDLHKVNGDGGNF